MTETLIGTDPEIGPCDDRLHTAPDEEGGHTAPVDGAISILRRGLRASPELRAGVRSSLGLALVSAVGKLIVPISIQRVIDRGIAGPGGVRVDLVATTCAVAAVAIVVVAVLNRATYVRLLYSCQDTLYGLRVRAFSHVHDLSLAHHNESKRGVLVTRVTSDVETLAQFAQWGAVSWIVNGTIVVVTLVVLAVYSWQLALLTVAVFVPVVPLMRYFQRRQLEAYDQQRAAVASTLTEISETVMGAAVIRAYSLEDVVRGRLRRAIDDQYDANMRAAWYFSLLFSLSDLIGATAVGVVLGAGVWWGPEWGLDKGTLVACIFLVTLLLTPIGEIGEVLDQTQTALAGWRKVLDLLEEPIDVVEPADGVELPTGPLAIDVDHLDFEYLPGEPVLRDVDLEIPAGANVALVGETGSGKTTFAKLLCRLADPTSGVVSVADVDLRTVDADARRRAIRLVPQDGFLFDVTLYDNIAMGAPGVGEEAVRAAVSRLGLDEWLARLPDGLRTEVGERGEQLSVGERQLVALIRAEVGDAGLLILDEATSAVDPETERALSDALVRLAEGRTLVSVAHRLSIAEVADTVVVFEHGRVVETGHHKDLVEAGGIYAGLYESWIGNTREQS